MPRSSFPGISAIFLTLFRGPVRACRSFCSPHETGIANPRAIFQREVNSPVRVNLCTTLSTAIQVRFDHSHLHTLLDHGARRNALTAHDSDGFASTETIAAAAFTSRYRALLDSEFLYQPVARPGFFGTVAHSLVRRPLAIILVLGVIIMIVAPLFRRYHKASPMLAVGAATVLAVAVVGLAHTDPRIGQAAIEANRRQYLYVLACEMPVLILALISFKYFKWVFWLGWAINLVFALYLTVIIVWLEFFWHW